MINLELYKQTRQWNINRGFTKKLDLQLESDMLEEEKEEFFDAYEQYNGLKDEPLAIDARLDLAVDMVDAVCDYLFVSVGLDAKSQLNRLPDADTQGKVALLKTNVDKNLAVMGALLIDVVGAKVDLNVCYGFVVEANNLKPAKSNADGKGVKGDEWVDPKHKIKDYLEELNVREYI
jgi:hypothetical protein